MQRASSERERPWAVVEITAGSDEGERTGLLRVAHRSSRSGVVALAFRGVPRQFVDRALDSVVDLRQDGVRGVVYMGIGPLQQKQGRAFSSAFPEIKRL
jgi:hypothetical protein